MPSAVVRCPSHRVKTLTHAPAAAATVDDILLVNGNVLIAYADIALGVDGEWIYEATDVEVPKVAATAITEGDAAYWDDSEGNFTNVSTDNTLCGKFTKAAASADTAAYIDLRN
jgi:predicted RecA/RadA family phage recombinase